MGHCRHAFLSVPPTDCLGMLSALSSERVSVVKFSPTTIAIACGFSAATFEKLDLSDMRWVQWACALFCRVCWLPLNYASCQASLPNLPCLPVSLAASLPHGSSANSLSVPQLDLERRGCSG